MWGCRWGGRGAVVFKEVSVGFDVWICKNACKHVCNVQQSSADTSHACARYVFRGLLRVNARVYEISCVCIRVSSSEGVERHFCY